MKDYYCDIETLLEKAAAYRAAMNLFDYDMQVSAPKKADANTSKIVGILADEYRNTFVSDELGHLLAQCSKMNKKGLLSAREKALLHEASKKRKELLPIDSTDYREFTELTTISANIWSKAKTQNDYQLFAPTLERIINYKRIFAKCRRTKHQNLYDVLLSDFEPDFTTNELDVIFSRIKNTVIPLLKNIEKKSEKNNEIPKWLKLTAKDRKPLKEFCNYISEYLGFDPERTVSAESAHPFTINIHNQDVRITNNFDGDNFIDPIFSAIHESGHGLYELGIANSITLTILGEGTSMGMHEGMSRFYENMIGRDYSFWKPLYPKLVSLFPDRFTNVSLNQFIEGINLVKAGPIRIQADELTYPLHIIIRYELEKELISGRLKTKNLKKEWNKRYKEYLGINPNNDSEGVLQDIHWAMGEFGYFPSYLIGSAIAAQIYYHLKDTMPYDTYLADGNINSINYYLKNNIFKYGKSLTTNSLLTHMTGESFNVEYYLKYLTSKWGN